MAEPSRDPAAVAAKSIYDLLLQRLRDDQGVHAETAICAAGAVTGDAIASALLGSPGHDAARDAALQPRIDAVLAYVRDRCTHLQVVLPDADEVALAEGLATNRDSLSLARDLRDGIAEIAGQFGVPKDDVPFVVARSIPALLSNTAAVLDSRVGYAIAVRALAAAARAPRSLS